MPFSSQQLKRKLPTLIGITLLLGVSVMIHFRHPPLPMPKVRKTNLIKPSNMHPTEPVQSTQSAPQAHLTQSSTRESQALLPSAQSKKIPLISHRRKTVVVSKPRISAKQGVAIAKENPEFDFEMEDADQALNIFEPLEELTSFLLAELTVEPGYDPNPLLSSVHLRIYSLEEEIPGEPRYGEVAGALKRNEFLDLKERYLALQSGHLSLGEAARSPDPAEIPEPPIRTEQEIPNVTFPKITVNARQPTQEPILVKPDKHLNTEPSFETQMETPSEAPSAGPRQTSGEPAIVENTKNGGRKDPAPSSKPTPQLAQLVIPHFGVPLPTVSTPRGVTIQPEDESSTPPIQIIRPDPPAQGRGVTNESVVTEPTPGEGGIIDGALDFDGAMSQWFSLTKGHVELYLHLNGSKNPQDTIHLPDYEFPSDQFRIDTRGFKGKYRLFAGIYKPDLATPLAQVSYREWITPESKKKIRFRISKKDFDRTVRSDKEHSSSVTLAVSVFEGNTSGHQRARAISNAEIAIMGLPERGVYRTDVEGNTRIEDLPVRSQFILSVRAHGFYPTFKIVPTFDSRVEYAPVPIVSKDLVATITQYFTKRPQDPARGLVFGQVFDPSTRAPLKDQQLFLSHRRGGALYFGALPDPDLKATTELGLFAFLNVAGSFRALYREGKTPMLLNIRPETAHFVELGRGGESDLMGQVLDPFNRMWIQARLRIVGGANEIMADGSGYFRFPPMDLPPGIITLEAEAAGYDKTWFTVGWNTREKEVSKSYYMLEKEILHESRKLSGVTQRLKMGSLVGGVSSSLLKKRKRCVAVQLIDFEGKPVSKELGPFPFSTSTNKELPMCLTASEPGFSFFNLPPGQYFVKWVDKQGHLLRSHVVYIGEDRVSVVLG